MIKKELFIEGVSVPIANMGIDFVKEIADIKEPQTRKSSYSKSVDIHGTKEVNILFKHYYDVNVDLDGSFNANKKVDAVYYEDSIAQFTGFFRLTEITINNDVITYKGTLHGELSSIFKDMGDSLISELDWSDLAHTYNEANIRANWAGVVQGVGYCYPMIDYLGKTTSVATDTWTVEDFRPAVFFLEIWDRIFAKYGYTYSSTFFSGQFIGLCMPSKSGKLFLTTQTIIDRSFDVGLNAEWYKQQNSNARTEPILFNDDSSGSFFNTLGSELNTSTGSFAPSVPGNYKLNVSIDTLVEYLGSATTLNASNKFVSYNLRLVRVRSGARQRVRDIIINDEFAGIIGSALNPNDRTTGVNFTDTDFVVNLIQGDVLYWTVENIPTAVDDVGTSPQNFASVVLVGSNFGLDYQDNELVDGQPLSIANVLPKMKQKDFIMGVIKAFNLYAEDLGEKELLIEQYDAYYTDDIVDWTNKKNGALTIVPNGNLEGKNYNFTFAKDEDDFHQRYFQEIGLNYGDVNLPIDSDFQTKTKEISLPFGSTLMTIPSAGASDRVIPTLYGVDSSGVATQAETKPRMIWYAGLIPCKSWTFGVGSPNPLTTYPYAGDTFNPYGALSPSNQLPSFLVWSKPLGYYYDGIYGTDTMPYSGKTMFENYETMLSLAQNPIIKASFYLNPMDVYNLSFRVKYFIDTAYYRLIKLSKNGDLYSGEFLKIG